MSHYSTSLPCDNELYEIIWPTPTIVGRFVLLSPKQTMHDDDKDIFNIIMLF